MDPSTERLIELARERGIVLTRDRAERLRPLLESLLDRLTRVAEALPRETAPPSSGVPRMGR